MSSLLSLVSAGTQGSISLSRSKDLLSTRIRVRSRALAADLGMLSSVSLSSLSCSLRLPMSPGSGLLVITDQCRGVQECRSPGGARGRPQARPGACVARTNQRPAAQVAAGEGPGILDYIFSKCARCYNTLKRDWQIVLTICICIVTFYYLSIAFYLFIYYIYIFFILFFNQSIDFFL